MKWISVEERLPEPDAEVLTARSNQSPRIGMAWYYKRDRWSSGFYSDGEMDTNVTHWMHLPDPPSKEKSALGPVLPPSTPALDLWVILYADNDMPPELVLGEAEARERLESHLPNWDCQLFKMVDDGKRERRVPPAEPQVPTGISAKCGKPVDWDTYAEDILRCVLPKGHEGECDHIRPVPAEPEVPSTPEKWISVKEKLPAVGGTYLVRMRQPALPSDATHFGYFVKFEDGPKWSISGTWPDTPDKHEITHWMEMPTPPVPAEPQVLSTLTSREGIVSLIFEEMLERDWSLSDISSRMGGANEREIQADHLALHMYLIVANDGCLLGDETSGKLDKAFGVSAGFFANMERVRVPPAEPHCTLKEAGCCTEPGCKCSGVPPAEESHK